MVVKGSTVKGQNLLARARYNEGRELYHVYGSVSGAKMRAYEDCLRWYHETNGDNFRIISHNSFQFSVAWELTYEYVNPKTGEVTQEEATRIETSTNTYIVLHNV